MILLYAKHFESLYNDFCSNTCPDETEWCKRSSLPGSGQHRIFVTGDNNNQPQHNHSPASGTSHFRKLTRSLKSSERSWGSLWGKCRIARFGGGSHSITHLRLCLHVSQECRIIASCIRAGAAFLTFFSALAFSLYHSQAAASGVFCEGVGYIGNPVTWAEVPSNYSERYFGRMKTTHREWAKDISDNWPNELT